MASYDVRGKGCIGGSSACAVPALETSGMEMGRERSRYAGFEVWPRLHPPAFYRWGVESGNEASCLVCQGLSVLQYHICHTYIHDNVYMYLHQSVGFLP